MWLRIFNIAEDTVEQEFEAFLRASFASVSINKVFLAKDGNDVCQGWGWLASDDLETQQLINALTWKGRRLYALP
jgi:hypothetical protein